MNKLRVIDITTLFCLVVCILGCYYINSAVFSICILVLIIFIEFFQYNVRYVLTCYKLKVQSKLDSFKLNNFQKFLSKYVLNNVIKELEEYEKLSKKA